MHTCTIRCLTWCTWRSSQLGRELRNGLRAYKIGKWLTLSVISNRILIETRIDRSQNQHTFSTAISTATKTNICLVLQCQPPPKPTYVQYHNINCHQNQHTFSTAIPTATKVNIGLGARRLETNSRILVKIWIFCRSINTPSNGPTVPLFLNAITWAATGQTLGILAKH